KRAIMTSWVGKRSWTILLVSALSIVLLLLVSRVSAAPYEPPPNQSSFPAASVPSWFEPASNGGRLPAATPVGLMSLPGSALYYAGQAKKRFSLNTMFMVFYAYAAVLVVWLLAGYNFGFGPAGFKITGLGILGIPFPALGAAFEGAQALIGPAQVALNIPNSNIVFFQF